MVRGEIVRVGRVLFNEEQIGNVVDDLAKAIRQSYKDLLPVFVGVLNGSLLFMADLIRALGDIDVDWTFVSASSYKKGIEPSEKVEVTIPNPFKLRGKHLLLIEDIIDTGYIVSSLLKEMKKYSPLSIGVCTLLNKPARRKVNVHVDFWGFVVENEFVVGYGLDYQGRYRNLPYLAALEFS